MNNVINSETVQRILREKSASEIEVRSKIDESDSIKNELLIEYETDCEVRSMFLRMDELGWKNKVISPFGLSLNYCTGHCKPIEFRPLTMIVRENRKIRLKIYDDLLIWKCGFK